MGYKEQIWLVIGGTGTPDRYDSGRSSDFVFSDCLASRSIAVNTMLPLVMIGST